jgi:tetratricopeptide (TPR) repeat protein
MILVDCCARCDTPLAKDAPLGLCPACLFAAVLATESTDLQLDSWPTSQADTPAGPRRRAGGTPGSWLDPPSTAHDGPDGFGSPPHDGVDQTRSEAGSSRTQDWTSTIGSQPSPAVPGYENLGLIGKGGMGVVYKALQCRANRLVALKMIRGDPFVQPEQLERFRFEVQAAALLRHANVVQIYEVGEVEGRPYFSLELLEGGTLKERLAAAPMSPQAAAGLLIELARAIDAAHRAGIIHRDLKPSNVLFDAQGTPKVADFGLAKRLESDDGQTLTGQVVGTPSYMAPEQARGDRHAVGPHSDIYALGAILYEMITGRPPFRGATTSDTLQLVLFQEPVCPSRLQPRVPHDLETICLKCLHKEPSRRYATAGELADDLGRFLAGELIRARPAPPWERALNWAKRRPVAAACAAVGLVAAVALGIGAQRYNELKRQELARQYDHDIRIRQKTDDALAASYDQRAKGELDDARLTLVKSQTELQNETRLGDLKRRVQNELAAVERQRNERAARTAAVSALSDRLARFRTLRDEALFRDAEIDALWRDLTSGDPIHGSDRLKRTRATARAALALFAPEDGAGPDSLMPRPDVLSPEELSEIRSGCCLILMVLSRVTATPLPGEDPKRQAGEGLHLLDQARDLDPPSLAFHHRRAFCLERLGDAEAAQRERASAAGRQPTGALDHILLGQERSRQGDWDSARAHFLAALSDRHDLFIAHCLLASAALNCSPPQAAEARAELTYCLHQQPSYAWLYLLRGFASAQMGAALKAVQQPSGQTGSLGAGADKRFAEAEADFRSALEQNLEDDLRYVLLANRGAMRFLRGEYEPAASDFREAIVLDGGRYNAYASLAQTLRRLDQRDEAVEHFTKAIALAPSIAALYRGRAAARTDGDAPTPDGIRSALADLEESSRREPAGSHAAADDHARRARLLLSLDRGDEGLAAALEAAEAALANNPGLAEACLLRVEILLALEKFEAVIDACDAALDAGAGTAELYCYRGLGRTGRRDYAGAINDFTLALNLKPDWLMAYTQRGWTYLSANAPELALRDFDRVVSLSPNDPFGYAGRGAARVRRGEIKEGLNDAEKSLDRGSPTSRILFIAAQTYAQAYVMAVAEAARRSRTVSRDALEYESRAEHLLQQALAETPGEERPAFWRNFIEKDPALHFLLRNPQVLRRLKANDMTSRPADPGAHFDEGRGRRLGEASAKTRR